MGEKPSVTVPRTPTEPATEDILAEMDPCTPYTVSDFVQRFDVSRWTIRRRLQSLVDSGDIRRKKHSENVLTWWVDVDDADDSIPDTDGGSTTMAGDDQPSTGGDE